MRIAEFINNKFFPGSSTRLNRGNSVSEIIFPQPSPFSLEKVVNNPTANRCLNMIVDASASIKYKVKDGDSKSPAANSPLHAPSVLQLINWTPNPKMDAEFFKRVLIMDLLTTGNAYIYVDVKNLYVVPAKGMKVISDFRNLVKEYEYDNETKFKPEEIIHIKDNSVSSMFTGETRLKSLTELIDLHSKMKDFQRNFFINNAMPGVVLQSPNTLTEKMRKRKLEEWKQDFNPVSGARKPAFLDGGIEVKNITTSTFREMDFEQSIISLEKDIAKSMGVPPILLDGGNNANISPNHRLFYLETVMPICRKIANAISLHFGYEFTPVSVGVPALQPDLRDLATYVSTLKNGGIITANEAREDIGKAKSDDPEADNLIQPANVAGSASDPSQGGRPKDPEKGKE